MANKRTTSKISYKPVAVARSVNFTENSEDWEVVQLAKLGLHQKAISARTGLTKSQVVYRLRQAGVQARGYRDGHSSEFKRVWSMADEVWKPAKAKAVRRELDVNHISLLDALAEARHAVKLRRTSKAK